MNRATTTESVAAMKAQEMKERAIFNEWAEREGRALAEALDKRLMEIDSWLPRRIIGDQMLPPENVASLSRVISDDEARASGMWPVGTPQRPAPESDKPFVELEAQQESKCYCFGPPVDDCPTPAHAERARKARV